MVLRRVSPIGPPERTTRGDEHWLRRTLTSELLTGRQHTPADPVHHDSGRLRVFVEGPLVGFMEHVQLIASWRWGLAPAVVAFRVTRQIHRSAPSVVFVCEGLLLNTRTAGRTVPFEELRPAQLLVSAISSHRE